MIRRSRLLAAGLAGGTMVALTIPSASAEPVKETSSPTISARDISACDLITGLDSLTPDLLSELFARGYAELRELLAECQKGTIPPKAPKKLKKPKVPRIAVPRAFWAYVTYTHMDLSHRTIPLDDPEICSKFVNGSTMFVTTSTAGFVVEGGGVGEVPVTAQYNEINRLDPAGCETPDPSKDGVYPGYFTVRLNSLKEIELDSMLGCGGYFPMPSAPRPCELLSLSETLPSKVKVSKKLQRDLANPRKGVIKIPISGGGGGDANSRDPRTCMSWGDGDTSYSCAWASSWAAQIILVRAEPLDLPVFTRSG